MVIFIQISTVVFAVGGHWYANFCVISKGIVCVKILTTIDTTKLKLCRIDDSFNNLMRAKTKKKRCKKVGVGLYHLKSKIDCMYILKKFGYYMDRRKYEQTEKSRY